MFMTTIFSLAIQFALFEMNIFRLQFKFKRKAIHYPNSFEKNSVILMSEPIKSNCAAKSKKKKYNINLSKTIGF